jgi:hypothetical protein
MYAPCIGEFAREGDIFSEVDLFNVSWCVEAINLFERHSLKALLSLWSLFENWIQSLFFPSLHFSAD